MRLLSLFIAHICVDYDPAESKIQPNEIILWVRCGVAIVVPLVEGNAYCSLLFDASVYVSWIPIMVSRSPAAAAALRKEANSIHLRVDRREGTSEVGGQLAVQFVVPERSDKVVMYREL